MEPTQRERLAAAAAILAAAEGRASTSTEAVTETSDDRPDDGSDDGPEGAVASRSSSGRAGRGDRADPADRADRADRGDRGDRGDRRRTPRGSVEQDADADPDEVARAIVLRQLSIAPRTRHQLATKLRQRGCADDVAERVLDRMTEVGLIDDEAYAAMVVRSQQAVRGLAKRALAHDLRGKGIADETIEDALGGIELADERVRAEAIATRTMRRLAGLEPAVQSRRLAGVLTRKGYSPSVVYPVVRDAVNDAPEHRRD